jgi:hypothetical protein
MAFKKEAGFQYQKRTREDLKERANMKGGNFDSIFKPKYKVWKPKEGKNLIRILPPSWKDARHYGLDIFVNYSIGADNQSYLSLSKHGKGADPLAEARREALAEGEKELAKKLNPSQRILYWVIDRNDEDEGPLLWAAPFTFDKALSNLCIDEDTKDVIFIDDPADGRDVRFYREGTMLNTNYDASKMKILGASNIHEDETIENEWLDYIAENPLPDVLNFYDYDHIKATFDGKIGGRDEEDDKPISRQHVSSRKHDPADDNDPPPRSRSRVKEPEPEPEPEVQPRRRRAAVEPEVDLEPAPRRRGRVADPEDDPPFEPDPPKREGGSLRERIAARRGSRPDPVDD